MRKTLALFSLLLPACAGTAHAAPNIFGTTGLITIPDARTVEVREANAHVHAGGDYTSFGGSLGFFRNLETGVTFIKGDQQNVLNVNQNLKAMTNAKYRLVGEKGWRPAFAVGVTDLFSEARPGSSFYGVASKTFLKPTPVKAGWSLTGHAGWGSGFYQETFFLGAEAGLGYPFNLFTFGVPVSVLADISGYEVSGGARARLPLGFVAEVHFVRQGTLGGAVSYQRRF